MLLIAPYLFSSRIANRFPQIHFDIIIDALSHIYFLLDLEVPNVCKYNDFLAQWRHASGISNKLHQKC